MFEGAVMATIQEMGGDYGLQRFVGNFGAIIFAPLGGFLIDFTNDNNWEFEKFKGFPGLLLILICLSHQLLVKTAVEKTVKNSNYVNLKTKH